ncbi:MAG: cbb3-type cytochrome oxidase assembly protein CcoS [Bacteroidia bacterium]|nr:cbb3-type cytochrome oxidase assembly protein CcoS [Bacteroidia bacterium]
MGAIYILVGASITVAIGFLIAFIWSVKNGQYEDDYTPSVRMLFDDPPLKQNESEIPSKDKLSKEL